MPRKTPTILKKFPKKTKEEAPAPRTPVGLEPDWTEDPRRLDDWSTYLWGQHASARALDMACWRLYESRPDTHSTVRDSRLESYLLSNQGRSYLFDSFLGQGRNLTRRVCDAAGALVFRKLQTKVLPVGNDAQVHQSAKLLGRLVDGIMDAEDAFTKMKDAGDDGLHCRVGAVKAVLDSQGEIRLLKCDPLLVLWDETEGQDVTQVCEIHPTPRRNLMRMYPGKAAEIKSAPAWSEPPIMGVEAPRTGKNDTVKVVEAWSKKMNGVDGRHTIVCGKTVLLDEPWPYDRFPISFYRWRMRGRSFGGKPLAEIVGPYHVQNNDLLATHRKSLKASIPRTWIEEDSLTEEFTDTFGEAISYRKGATPPNMTLTNVVNQDYVAQMQQNVADAFAEAGVNEQVAAGTMDRNVDSAPAQRERMEIISARLYDAQSRWEQFYKDIARSILMLAMKAYPGSKVVRVKAPGSQRLEEIRWAEVKDLKENQYDLRVQLASGLSLTYSGRYAQLNDLEEKGLIDKKDMLRNLQLVDTDSQLDELNAGTDLAMTQVTAALDHGKWIAPTRDQDLQELVKKCTVYLQRALSLGTYERKNVALLTRLKRNAERLLPPAPPVTEAA